mgnify:FL=1
MITPGNLVSRFLTFTSLRSVSQSQYIYDRQLFFRFHFCLDANPDSGRDQQSWQKIKPPYANASEGRAEKLRSVDGDEYRMTNAEC